VNSQCELLIAGATVVTETGGRETNVAVSNGIVEAIGPELPRASRTIDAEGLVLLPGGVDPHTHLNSAWPFPDERRPADDFRSGSRAAAAGGITTVCDFVYHLGDETLVEAANRVADCAAQDSCIDYSLHVVITELKPAFVDEIEQLISSGYPSFKFYTQLPDFVANAPGYIELLHQLADAGGLAMFHCEDASIIDYCCGVLTSAGKTSPRHYPASKPPQVEESATAWALNLAAVAGAPAYIVHLSSAGSLELALAARQSGNDVLIETRPLYLHLTDECFDASDAEAACFIGTPPLRSSRDRARLWQALEAGDINMVGSDHVGFTREQKYKPGDTFATVPKGVANMESMLAMLYSEGVRVGRLSLEQLADLTATQPAKTFGLYPQKGVICEGSDADFCLLDPLKRRKVDAKRLHSAADFDPFEGREVTGWPVLTVSRGEVVFEDGAVRAASGRGHLVKGNRYSRTLSRKEAA